MDALIGYTGFVGSNLALQHPFNAVFHSRNIDDMRHREFERVICAGVQAKKWWANEKPAEDWSGIRRLLDVLETIQTKEFVLISTVDVYPQPKGVTETTFPDGENHAYGRHRLAVEQFAREHFSQSTILRLPGLFGRNLKKNVIFDLLHDNCLAQINPSSVYQYYNLDHLWSDIVRCQEAKLPLLNLATEPVPTANILDRYFPEKRGLVGESKVFAINYDMRTEHAVLWKSKIDGYLYDRETVLEEIGLFIGKEKTALSA
ncbi:MAG: NAD(P)-dependent oxidoreductase [Verrucomicrobiaceae bacterium]|nr:MAG: NAD(P)-dependent oxidoreductase [Verrucomicrobiaceae bacterium]